MNLVYISAAYKFVAVALMMAEANYFCSQLKLSGQALIHEQTLQVAHVNAPRLTGFGGAIDTSKYSFGFRNGRLCYITRLNRFENIPLRELQWKLSTMTSQIDSNEAQMLATEWLKSISVDISRLEKSFPPIVSQRYFKPDAKGSSDPPEKQKRIIMLPIFDVVWGDAQRKIIVVSVFGPTKELLVLRQEDDMFSKRPVSLIRDFEKLLTVSDEEFNKYSSAQRTRLISDSATFKYSSTNGTWSSK